jgi:hypothetical protein
MQKADFRITTIADTYGTENCNIGDLTTFDPVYGVDKNTFTHRLT